MRLIVGILFWVAVLITSVIWIGSGPQKESDFASTIAKFLTSSRKSFELDFDQTSVLKIGDPVIIVESDTSQVVGSVTAVSKVTDVPVPTDRATVEFYSSAPDIAQGDYLTYHQTPASMDWVVQMMLPSYKRAEIGNLIAAAYQEHYAEIANELQPILIQSVKDAADVVRQEFYTSIQNRETQISNLGNRYQVELVEQELIPLIKDEIWPIVQRETKPLATEVGEEMFQHASVWRFGWRFIYDRSPLPEKNLVQKEFQRFMDKHGIPVIESHLPEFLQVQQNVMKRASENKQVQEVVSETSMRILRDPEFQKLTTDILKDVFVDNQKLLEVFEQNWNSPEAKRALLITNQKLDPTITKIGQALFGSPEQSITPEFSRILRNRILHKDDRWLVLHLSDDRQKKLSAGEKLLVRPGTTGTENPFHVPAREKF